MFDDLEGRDFLLMGFVAVLAVGALAVISPKADAQVKAAQTSAVLHVSCMSDGSMKIESSAKP